MIIKSSTGKNNIFDCHQDGTADGCLEVLCSFLLVFLCVYSVFCYYPHVTFGQSSLGTH